MNVLVVDDQLSMRLISTAVVQSLGHEVISTGSGHEAIDICKDQKVDLVLMDVEMPSINGFETTKLIREQSKVWFPIIFVSAKTDPKFFVEGIKSGGDIYLFKPIVPEVLESMIKAMQRISEIQGELHSTKVRMELLAHQDQLTSLVNRRGFDNAMDLEFKRAEKDHSSLTLIILDVDFFKSFNDNYGHQAGDECLVSVGAVLKKVISRPNDIVARYGGEEFAIILPNTSAQQAESVSERILAGFQELALPHEYSSCAAHITVSGGIAEQKSFSNIGDMIKAADDLLYLAKESGRNQIRSSGSD